MLTAVQLDRQLCYWTRKIHYVPPDRMLTAEPLWQRQLTQRTPELLLPQLSPAAGGARQSFAF